MKRSLSVFLTIALLLSIMPNGLFGVTASAVVNGEYIITYHLDGGVNALKNPDVYTDEDTIVLKDATKTGYTFSGWFLDEAKTKAITQISNRTGNIDIYAKFTANTYIATFNGNGADVCGYKVTLRNDKTGEEKCVYLNNGESFSPHEYWKPEADGYVYAGWMYGSEVLSDTLQINADIELVPKWIDNPNNYPVLGDGTSRIYACLRYLGDQAITEKKMFFISYDYEDYTYYCRFQKYICDCEGDGDRRVHVWSAGKIDKYYVGSSMWSSIVYRGDSSWNSFDRTGLHTGSSSGSFSATPGTLLRAYIELNESGWHRYPQNPLSGQEVFIQIEPGDKRKNIGRVEAKTVVEFGEHLNAPSAQREGYTFLGWYDSQGNPITDTWQYTANKTFTAKWELTKYYIAYELNGGINNVSNPTAYTTEETISLKDPTKPGYAFEGWYSDADFTTQVTSISKETGNITLYARWAVNSYNLTLNANEGGFAPKVTFISDGKEIKSCYLYDQDYITAYRPAGKDGYIFAGWYTDDLCTSLFKFNGTITDDITLYAKWISCNSDVVNVEPTGTINLSIQGKTVQRFAFVPLADGMISIKSESNNLDLYGTLCDANGKVLVSADDVSGTDLDFAYTYSVIAGQLYYATVSGVTATTVGQTVINIVWTGDCTITGTTYQNRQLTVVYDTNLKLPQKPVREGYVFLGWFDENDARITDGTWKFVTDKTLTAKWVIATSHLITFKDAEGNVLSSEIYYLGDDLVAPELPIREPDETYTYTAKWDNEFSGVCTGDAVYTVVFEKKYIDYTITFKNWDGTIREVVTAHYGDTVIPRFNTDEIEFVNGCSRYYFLGLKSDNGDLLDWPRESVVCYGDMGYRLFYDVSLEHDLIQHRGKAPTCTEIGWNAYETCSRCEYTTYVELPALGHKLTQYPAKSPTCTEIGWGAYETCSQCNYSTFVEAPAMGHSFDGSCDSSCNKCGYIRETDPHSYVGTVTTEPTIDTDGVKTYTCSVCGDTYTEVIPKFTDIPCGDNLTWSFSSDGVLTISGTGDMYQYSGMESVPWYLLCDSIKEVVINEGVTSIGSYAFYYCDNLTNVTIPASIQSSDMSAFSSWNTKLDAVYITDLTAWCRITFNGASSANPLNFAENLYLNGVLVTDLVIPEGITQIKKFAFFGCNSITSVVIPDGVKSIDVAAFGSCKNVTSISIPHSVTNMDMPFWGCVSLESVIIPNSLNSITGLMFEGCSALTSVTIPSSVKAIFSSAFKGCTALATVYYQGKQSGWNDITIYSDNEALTNANVIFVPCDEHIWDDGSVELAPTCTTEGVKRYTCTGCDTERTETMDALGHDLTQHNAKSPTCVDIGWNAYESCSRCAYATYVEITALGHTYDNACDAECDVCGEMREITHNYQSSVIAPTCVNDGYTTYTCSVCGATYVTNHTAALGHTYDNACDASCNVCGSARIPSDHVYEAKMTTAPTCGLDGVKTYTCSVCGDSYSETIAATGNHIYDNDCDSDCNTCGSVRVVLHRYSNDFDVDCDDCGAVREVVIPISFGGNSTHENVSGLAFRFDVAVQGMERENAIAIYDNAAVNGYKLLSMGAIVTNGFDTRDVPAVYLCGLKEDTASFAVRIIEIPNFAYNYDITATPYIILEIDGVATTIYGEAHTASYNGALA